MAKTRKVKLIYKGSLEDLDPAQSVRYWQSQSAETRLNAVWEMVQDAWELKGKNLNELRFQRSTALLKRI
jgi:hypothetical protein